MHTQHSAPHFDLTRVRALVMRDHPDWTPERFDATEAEYRRFLQLCKIFPDRKISAPPDVDKVWHSHMLDSVSYTRDCDAYFGNYLHHDPCIGSIDAENGRATLQVYEKIFGTKPPSAWEGVMTCAGAGQGCGSIQTMEA